MDCNPVATQKIFCKKTAGHNEVIHSHVVEATPLTADELLDKERKLELEEFVDPATGATSYSYLGPEYRFTIRRHALGFNDTPYWIMSVPPQLIRGHSDIFTLNTLQLIRALMRVSGATGEPTTSVLVRDNRVRPLYLIALPEGGIGFLERSRRLYALVPNGRRPLALSCLPPLVNPERVIGSYNHGTQAYLIASGKEKGKDGKKLKVRTDVVGFDFNLSGATAISWTEIESDVRFIAGAGDPVRNKVYLTSTDGLYVADLSAKKPKAELWRTLESVREISWLTLDPDGSRLYALDRNNGEIHALDLNDENAEAERIADNIGNPTDLLVTRRGSLLVVDAENTRILEIRCGPSSPCSAPEVFAAPEELRFPTGIEQDADGTFWVADLEARKILHLDERGQVRRVLETTAGFND